MGKLLEFKKKEKKLDETHIVNNESTPFEDIIKENKLKAEKLKAKRLRDSQVLANSKRRR